MLEIFIAEIAPLFSHQCLIYDDASMSKYSSSRCLHMEGAF